MSESGDDSEAIRTAENAQALAREAASAASAIADSLTETLGKVTGRLNELQASSKASRRTIVVLVISLVLDVALSVVAIFLVISLNTTQNQLADSQAQATQASLSQCAANNVSRTQDKTLWTTLLNDLDPPGTKVTAKNAAVIKEINSLRSIVTVRDVQRDCARIYG